ncbi:MAG TPA: glycosyltransferase [Acidimicrobiales bacterium]|nr:glycosyltransferase [Acidimicrobiales bacterium]
MSDLVLRVALDLDGSLESLGNSMDDLADALAATGGCELVRFRSTRPPVDGEAHVAGRWLFQRAWRQGRGRAIDALLPPVDLVHVAGVATPPTRRVPLVISVDDLRPLREESRTHQRVAQLSRALSHGATLVASSRAASHEVLDVLHVERHQVVVVPPAVPTVAPTFNGQDLVVNVTGAVERLLAVADSMVELAQRVGARVVVVASDEAGAQVRARASSMHVRARRDARSALAGARAVLHLSDGARFPSFAIAALAAGVPTVARSTAINRELLGGAAVLVERNEDVVGALEEILTRETHRAVLIAAGRDRAVDFAPSTAARAYLDLYREVVQGWST